MLRDFTDRMSEVDAGRDLRRAADFASAAVLPQNADLSWVIDEPGRA
jgi:hypothetical protein